jgi:serine protease Do
MKQIDSIFLCVFLLLPVASQAQDSGWSGEKQTTNIIQKVTPSVVSIYLIPESQQSVVPDANTPYGTGVIVHSEGLVLTSLELVQRGGYKTIVFLTNGSQYQAKMIGKSSRYGIALLKIPASQLQALPLADTTKLSSGTFALKFGNAFQTAQDFLPAAHFGTVSGVVDLPNVGILLRTDLGVNPGDYGGPLVDLQGRLLGILMPMWVHPTTNTYVSYAVPAHAFKELLPEMKGYFGILLTVSDKESDGALVEMVDPAGPASKGGIKQGDMIVSINGKNIKNAKELVDTLQNYMAGDQIQVVVQRKNSKKQIAVTLGVKSTD